MGVLTVGLLTGNYCIIKYKLFIDCISVTHLYSLLYWAKLGFDKSLEYCVSVRRDCKVKTTALDLQQKLKPFVHSSQEQIAMRSFLEFIALSCGSDVRYISVISSVFCRFIFKIDTASCGTVLPPSKISSSCRSD